MVEGITASLFVATNNDSKLNTFGDPLDIISDSSEFSFIVHIKAKLANDFNIDNYKARLLLRNVNRKRKRVLLDQVLNELVSKNTGQNIDINLRIIVVLPKLKLLGIGEYEFVLQLTHLEKDTCDLDTWEFKVE